MTPRSNLAALLFALVLISCGPQRDYRHLVCWRDNVKVVDAIVGGDHAFYEGVVILHWPDRMESIRIDHCTQQRVDPPAKGVPVAW